MDPPGRGRIAGGPILPDRGFQGNSENSAGSAAERPASHSAGARPKNARAPQLPFYDRRVTCLRLVSITALLLMASAPAMVAVDWPGLWGPARNGITSGELTIPSSDPKVLWRRAVRGGYSEIALQGGRAFTMELHEGVDYVTALDGSTGRELWRVEVGPTYRGHGGSDDGPISTPAVADNDLFALGPRGHLIAVDVASGKERWRHDLVRAFGAAPPTWGFAASPLIEGSVVIVPTGGPDSKGLLAFDRRTGRPAWNAAVSRATAYSSAVSATIGGVRQVIAVSSDRVYAVAPADGRVLWSAPGPGGTIEVANSPLVLEGDRVLVSNWEQSLMIGMTRRDGEFVAGEQWRTPRLRGSNGPTIYRDGFLYGFAGAVLICMNAETGDVRWRERTGAGTVIAVGDRLVFLGQDSGELQIASVTPDRFILRHRARVRGAGIRAVTGPSYAAGRLYVRNLQEIVALQVS
jgi:outer membrane protein assembly factor BamB